MPAFLAIIPVKKRETKGGMLASKRKAQLNNYVLIQDDTGNNMSQWRMHRRISEKLDRLPNLSEPLFEYERTLSAIIEKAEELSVRLVLVTQPTLWRNDLTESEKDRLWLGGIGNFRLEKGHSYYRVAALEVAMREFNDVTLKLCKKHSVECIDLARHIPADTTMFYDDVHFTEKGAAKVGEVLTDYFVERPPFN